MRKITLPVSNPKKTLSGDLLKNAIPKPLPAGTTRPSAIKAVAGGLAGASTRGIGAIPAGAETDAGTNGESPRLNPTQQRDAALVAKLPSGFPIQEWDSMSPKAQLQAMKFSGLTEQEQWQLLNPSAPLGVLDAANRERIQAVASAGVGKSTEILTNPSKTTYLQNGESDGQLGKDGPIATPRPGPTPRIPVKTPVPLPSNSEIAYIFYTNSQDADFRKQAEYQKGVLTNQGYRVKLVCVDNVTAFSNSWNHMDPKTGAAVIICHCNGMSLMFEHNTKTNAISAKGENIKGEPLPSISDLRGPEVALLYLYACNSAHKDLIEHKGTNVADAFRDLPNVDIVYGYDGGVGFGVPVLTGDNYEPRLAIDQRGYFSVYNNFGLDYDWTLPTGLVRYDDTNNN